MESYAPRLPAFPSVPITSHGCETEPKTSMNSVMLSYLSVEFHLTERFITVKHKNKDDTPRTMIGQGFCDRMLAVKSSFHKNK